MGQYKIGIVTGQAGAKMLIKDDSDQSKYNVAVVTKVQATGSPTVECKIQTMEGEVIEESKEVNIAEDLHALPWSWSIRSDAVIPTRQYFDTPFGTFVLMFVPFVFFYTCPIWKVSPLDCSTFVAPGVPFLTGVFGLPQYGWCGEGGKDAKGDWMAEKDEDQKVYEPIVGG